MREGRTKKFIKDVQLSEHHVKARWVFLFSAIAMILAILMWMLYFRSTVEIAGPKPAGTDTAAESGSFPDLYQSE